MITPIEITVSFGFLGLVGAGILVVRSVNKSIHDLVELYAAI